MTRVQISNLRKTFGSTVAVDDVSLDVATGEFVVLLGPSGCGKTSTLRCVAGLETPDSGDIFIGDTRANDLPPKDRDVAMVFQTYALYPHMTVFDNIGFPLKMRKIRKSEIKQRVNEVGGLLNIQHLLERKPRQLSGGEQQRVALGRALVRSPKVFLMDEPLSNLDAKLRIYTRSEIKRLHEELKVTTIYVTHDQAEAMSMADKVAVMNKGKVVQYDDPFTIYRKPSNTFVAGFVGSPPTNLIKATITNGAANAILDAGSFKYQTPADLSEVLRRNAADSEVHLGIRPEDFVLSLTKTNDSIFEAEVYVVEPLGASTVVDIKVGSDIIKTVVQGEYRTPTGTKIWVGFPADKLHVFAGKSGKLIV